MMKIVPVLFCFFIVVFTSCQRELASEPLQSHELRITFRNRVDTSAMQLGRPYQNPFGETYSISMFKYYVSNIRLREPGGNFTNLPGIYHLVDESEPGSSSFVLKVPDTNYTGLSFLLGVDSARNVSGTQTGDLDPLKGMFWTWNSGYVMAKMEATSPVSTAPNNNVTIHVGGFKTGENAAREITPAFPLGTAVAISNNDTSEIIIDADANTWFKGVHDLKITDNPVCTTPGELATRFADNYSGMFKVVSIIN